MRKYILIISCDKCGKEFRFEADYYDSIVTAVNIAANAGTIIQARDDDRITRDYCAICDPARENYLRYK